MHNAAQRRTTNPPKKPNEPKKWGYRPRAQIGLSGQGTPNPTAEQKSGYIPGYRALHPEPAATVLQTAHGAVHRDKSDKMQHNATENPLFQHRRTPSPVRGEMASPRLSSWPIRDKSLAPHARLGVG
jgi:hypothetical protein